MALGGRQGAQSGKHLACPSGLIFQVFARTHGGLVGGGAREHEEAVVGDVQVASEVERLDGAPQHVEVQPGLGARRCELEAVGEASAVGVHLDLADAQGDGGRSRLGVDGEHVECEQPFAHHVRRGAQGGVGDEGWQLHAGVADASGPGAEQRLKLLRGGVERVDGAAVPSQPQVDEARRVGGQHLALDEGAAQGHRVFLEERVLEALAALEGEGRLPEGWVEPEASCDVEHRDTAEGSPHIGLAARIGRVLFEAPSYVSAHCMTSARAAQTVPRRKCPRLPAHGLLCRPADGPGA